MITTVNVVSRALLYLLPLLTACSANGHQSVIRYELAETNPNVIDEGIAFSLRDGIVITYSKPYSPEYLSDPTDFSSGAFRYRESDGLIMEAVTRISVPKDIEGRKEWTAFGSKCTSVREGGKYRVNCEDSRGSRSYTFSEDIGIEEFDFPCGAVGFCKYELVSKTGIFAKLH